jgi:ribosomal protein S12 methylthiotransferase accessory factor
MARFLFGEKIKNLRRVGDLFLPRVPRGLLDPLAWFLQKIESALGASLFVGIPEHLADIDPALWKSVETLEILKEEGIITAHFKDHMSSYPDEPRLKSWTALLADDKGYRGYSGYGYDFFNHTEAIGPAVGEALERWALNNFKPSETEIRTTSYNEIKKEGALDIFSVAGFTPEFRAKKHTDYTFTFDEYAPFQWVRGESLIQKKPLWIPYQLTSFAGQHRTHNKKEAVISKIISTGGAAHISKEKALVGGILEVVQRDAFMLYWLRKITPQRIDVTSIESSKLRFIEEQFKRYNLSFYCLYLKTDVPAHTVVTVIIDKTGVGPAVCVGASTGFDITDVVYKSILETFASRLGVRKLLNFHLAQGKTLAFNPQTIGHEERLLYWCDMSRLPDISFFTAGKEVDVETLPVYEEKGSELERLLAHFKKTGEEVCFTNLLSRELEKKLSLYAVMVTIPTFQPLHLEEAFPFFGGARLELVPNQLELTPGAALNTVPHPFP